MRPAVVALAVGAVLALLGALGFAGLLASATVGVVRIAGDLGGAEREQVEAAVGRELARRPTDPVRAVASAVGSLAWVRAARVRRHWPDALAVEVARETLTARWGGGWLTASGGFVANAGHFVADAGQPKRLPQLPIFETIHTDAAAGREAMRVFETVNAAASAGGLVVARLEEDAASGWTAVFAGGDFAPGGDFAVGGEGLRLVLGREDLGARTRRFVHVYRQALRYAEPIAFADVRYDRGVAVRRRGPTGAATSPVMLAAATTAGPAADPGGRD